MGGFFAGLQAGYNHQLNNNVVLGIESDFQWSDLGARPSDNTHFKKLRHSAALPIGGYITSQACGLAAELVRHDAAACWLCLRPSLLVSTRRRCLLEFLGRKFGLWQRGVSEPRQLFQHHGLRLVDTVGYGRRRIRIGLTGRVSLKSKYLNTGYSGFTSPYFDYEGSDPPNTTATFSSRQSASISCARD